MRHLLLTAGAVALAAVAVGLAGWTWNFELVPCSQATPSRPRPPPNTADSRSPG